MSTADEVREYVVGEYLPGMATDDLDTDYDLLANGVIDSLGLLKLVAWVRDRFDVPVDDLDIAPENFRSVRAIRAFVEAGRRYTHGEVGT
ncbi:MAG: phosphopantetheine-binding protein [Micromonosporaceae bacterium]